MYKRRGILVERVFKTYFLPTIMMSMALSMGVIVDGIIVGNTLGSDALAAVNLVMPVVLCFNTIYAMFGIGGSALASIAKGKRDTIQADSVFTLSVLAMMAISILLLVAGVLNLDKLAYLIAGDSVLLDLVREYLGVLILGAPFLIVVSGFVYFVRADGRPNLASVILIVANVVNLCMDLVNLLVFKMGIEGAALGTVSGYVVGLVILLRYIFSKNRTLHFSLKQNRNLKQLGSIAASGIPSALGSLLLFIKIFFINSIVLATLGHLGMVAFSVCLSCLSFVSMFIAGASQTMMPILGTLFGEKDLMGIRFTAKRAFLVVMTACIALVSVFELFPVFILFLFGVSDPAEIAMGVEAIRIFALSLLGVGFSFFMIYYFQTLQKRVLSSAVAIVQGGSAVVFAFLLSGIGGGTGIWLSFIFAEICSFVLVILITSYESKRSGGLLKSIFLFETEPMANLILDVTIANVKEEATGLSEKVIGFCTENGVNARTAMHVGLAVEEMAANTIQYGYKKKGKNYIDIKVRITNDEVIIGVRDDGVPFDPTTYREEEKKCYSTSGIALVKAIAKSVQYARLIGMNSSIIKISLS